MKLPCYRIFFKYYNNDLLISELFYSLKVQILSISYLSHENKKITEANFLGFFWKKCNVSILSIYRYIFIRKVYLNLKKNNTSETDHLDI